ncbi:transglycosylase SLT domain-containing protein, partial [Fulvivirga kasyanovii]
MFESKSPVPGNVNSDPLKDLLDNKDRHNHRNGFHDPFAKWDDGADSGAMLGGTVLKDEEENSFPDINSLTLGGALANINLEEHTLAGYLSKRGGNPSAEPIESNEPPATTYVVKSGDTVASVASSHGISEEALKKANPDQAKRFLKNDQSGYIWSFKQVGATIVVPSQEVAPVVEEVSEATAVSPGVVPTEIAEVPEGRKHMASEDNAILETLVTGGAGDLTTKQDGEQYTDTGVQASERMAARDLELMGDYVETFKKVGKKYNIPPALVAALASRESRGGKALDANGYGDDGEGFGLMQVDKESGRTVAEGAYSEAHVDQAVSILVDQLRLVTNKHPNWTYAQRLKGAVAAYNFGSKNVQSLEKMDQGTTGHDYSSDVWARARYYAGLKTFEGEGVLKEEVIAREITMPALTREEAEAENSIISASVGKPNDASKKLEVHTENINFTADLRLMQDRLLELGLLTRTAYDKEYNAMVVSVPAKLKTKGLEGSENEANTTDSQEIIRKQVLPDQIPLTIEAITTFQREVQRGTVDGRIDPGGGTIRALMDSSLTPELVSAKQEKYKQDKAEEEKKAREEAAEKARIEAIKNEPATEENALRLLRGIYTPELRGYTNLLLKYGQHNPRLAREILRVLSKQDGGIANLLSIISSLKTQELPNIPVRILEQLIVEAGDYKIPLLYSH